MTTTNTQRYQEIDKKTAAYLLLCSDLVFEGTNPSGDLLIFEFSPEEVARRRSEQYISRKAEPIQPKDYAEAEETITNLIWKWRKEKDLANGEIYDHRKNNF